MLPSNARNHCSCSFSFLVLLCRVATVSLGMTARLPWSHVCHRVNLALPGQKSSVLLPQSTSQRWPSVPTADDEINYFLFLQTTHLISSASDWKFNPAGSCLQFKPKKPQVISNWPSDYLITVYVLRLQHFFSLVRPLTLPSVQSLPSWASFNLGA